MIASFRVKPAAADDGSGDGGDLVFDAADAVADTPVDLCAGW